MGLNNQKLWRLNFINELMAPNPINMRKDTVIVRKILS